MVIGVPKELKNNENRVSIIPFGVEDLQKSGHTILVQSQAGSGSGFDNDAYSQAGAEIIDSPNEIFQKADLIVKVKEPQPEEYPLIRPNQILFTYFHFAADEILTSRIRETKAIYFVSLSKKVAPY